MRHLLLGGYALLCLTSLVWPVYAQVGAHIEPFVLGLPLSFAWVIGWIVTTFAVLITYHLADSRHIARAESPDQAPGQSVGDA